MRYYIWDRQTNELLASCEYLSDAYTRRAAIALKQGRPNTDYRISYE